MLLGLLISTPPFAANGWRISSRTVVGETSTSVTDITPSHLPAVQPVVAAKVAQQSPTTNVINKDNSDRAKGWWKKYRKSHSTTINSDNSRSNRLQARLWQSESSTRWSHDASQFDSFLGNPTSRLDYRDAKASILEVGGQIAFSQGFYLAANVGSGNIDSGVLQDEDFISAEGAAFIGTTQQGEHAFSSTDSNITGNDVRYFDIKFGKSLLNRGNKQLGIFAQYQDWRERYRASAIRQTVCAAPNVLCVPAGFSGFNDTTVISNRTHWRSFDIGLDGKTRIGDKLSLSGNLAYTPKADVDNRDIHFLRDDLAKNPSILLQGNGRGFKFGIDAEYAFTPKLSATLGWRYWQLKSDTNSGGVTFFPAGGGTSLNLPLNELETKRTGISLGLKL